MEDKNIKMAERIASRVELEGGRAYYVGGYCLVLEWAVCGCPVIIE